MDIPEPVVRAARARAGFDAVDLNVIITRALEEFLREELTIVRRKEEAMNTDRPLSDTQSEEQHNEQRT
jgi:hypothetical protein